MSFLFCLPFANRASVSGDPNVDFNWNHLIFPVACLVCLVTSLFIIFLPEHAYASHIISCISYMFASCCLCISRGWLWFCLFVFLSWVEPGDEYVNEEPVEYAYKDQGNFENFAGKMTIPLKSLLSLLARCSLFCYAFATIPTTCLSCLPYCHVKPITHLVLANRCLAMLPLLLSPSYSVACCKWSWSLFHDGTWLCWDITISLI